MTPKQLIKHYGSDNKAALSLGLSVQAVRKWIKSDSIPEWSQNSIAWLTNGALKPNRKAGE